MIEQREAAMMRRNRIARVIEEFDAQGIHRTATEVDRRSADWLAAEVEAIGLTPALEGYPTDRLDVEDCYIEVAGRRIEGVPLFDCTYTGPDGIRGRFGLHSDGSEVALFDAADADADDRMSRLTAFMETRRSSDIRALVIAPTVDAPQLSLLNAIDFEDPFGPPVIQVSGEDAAWLRARASGEAEALFVALATRTRSTAYNVTAQIAGTGQSTPPLWINTPRSGWWEVAAERGGGIACWLEVMRIVANIEPDRPVRFSATTSHELGYAGVEALLDAHTEAAADATWIHFGANIGARSGSRGQLFASTEELRTLAESELSGVRRPTSFITGRPGGGEMAVVHRRGGRRYIALTNDNGFFHMREDRYPENVDVDIVEEFAVASSSIALSLLGAKP